MKDRHGRIPGRILSGLEGEELCDPLPLRTIQRVKASPPRHGYKTPSRQDFFQAGGGKTVVETSLEFAPFHAASLVVDGQGGEQSPSRSENPAQRQYRFFDLISGQMHENGSTENPFKTVIGNT
jgi:hypothetical protein